MKVYCLYLTLPLPWSRLLNYSAASVTELRTFLGVTKLSDIWVRVTRILK